MFERSKPVVFDPYAGRRGRRRVPRWLVLLVLGIALGAGGVVYVQEQQLPPRLSAQASTELRASFERADAERKRLAAELAGVKQRLDTTLAERQRLTQDVATARETIEGLRTDVKAMVDSLPPDPRGGAVEVRVARFSVEDGQLAYDVVLSRDRAGTKPLVGVMQLIVAGESGRPDDTVKLAPVDVSVAGYQNLRGNLPLPAGFKPRQATVHVLDRPDGKRLGMRVMNVK
jgi:hypothetical protein